jgi:hypothetical protein
MSRFLCSSRSWWAGSCSGKTWLAGACWADRGEQVRGRSTTGIWAFAECRRLCRVLFIGHSAKKTLPSTALGKVPHSVKSLFTECRTLGTTKHPAKTSLPSGKHSAKTALGKGPLAAVYSWRSSVFAEGRKQALVKADSLSSVKYLALGKEGLYRVSSVDTRQSIFLFFLFWPPNFLWYIPTLCRPTCTILGQL